ncbi:hypothetical protein [Methylobacterium platani]|uniref:hypothetical protein n=1 Tax=Methylobacterium platani TaxID=427683 RepID=UPI0012E30092|nr:hypothetical protein [Methylobacterium platani]
MSFGGKARPKEQAALRMPEEFAHPAEHQDAVRARIRAHVRHILLQAGSRASIERD